MRLSDLLCLLYSGDIKLNFTSTSIDVIQSPVIHITDTRYPTTTEVLPIY